MKEVLHYNRVFRVSVPIIFANATIPLIGVCDTAVIGQLDNPVKLAAVGLGSLILSTIFWLFGFLRMGTTGLASKARGENNQTEIINSLLRALMGGFLAGIFLLIFQNPLKSLSLLLFQVSEGVESLTISYIEIRIWSAPLNIMIYAAMGWLIAMERTTAVLILQCFTNLLNIALDLYFVLWLELGVFGVAVASVIAEVCGGIVSIIFCWIILKQFREPWDQSFFEISKWKKMMSVNFNIFVRSLLLEFVIISYIIFSTTFGTVTLAANQVLLHFLSVAAYVLDGIAFSTEVFVGIAFGTGSKKNFNGAVEKCAKLAFLFAVIFSGLYLLFGNMLIDFLVVNQDVRNEIKKYIIFAAITPITGVSAWLLDGIFIGSTKTIYMRKAMTQSVLFYLILLLFFFYNYNNLTLWVLINLFLIARACSLARYYPKIYQSLS